MYYDWSEMDLRCTNIWRRLIKKTSAGLKAILFKKFALPHSESYEQFMARMLQLGKAVAVYMVALQKLA